LALKLSWSKFRNCFGSLFRSQEMALGRKNWLFAGSDNGDERAAGIALLIEMARLKGLDSWAWLTHVLIAIADHPVNRIDDLLPWNFKQAH